MERRTGHVRVALGDNQYGKAEIRMVALGRDGERYDIRDLNVGVALSGDLTAVHRTGDNAHVVPTDTMKNTVYAFAREEPVGAVEAFALRLGRHFVAGFELIARARVSVEEYAWERITIDGEPHPHAFRRPGGERRTTTMPGPVTRHRTRRRSTAGTPESCWSSSSA